MSQTASQIPTAKIIVSRSDAERSAVNWRTVSVGTLAVALICGLTPYNNLVLSDTSLSAGFLPLGAVLVMFALIVFVNAPLRKFLPRHAFSGKELAVILLTTLVASALPDWGLMRYFPATLASPFRLGTSDSTMWNAFKSLGLPNWLYPVPITEDGRDSGIVQWFYTSVPPGQPIPWSAWIRPLAIWSVFISAMLATLTAMGRLIFDQWFSNERLPFPIVQAQAALVESPRENFALNDLFRSSWLWIGLGGVVFIHGLTILNTYQPTHFPKISLGFDLSTLFADPPLFYFQPKIKAAQLSFVLIGVTYFIRSRAAFSLWATYFIVNLVEVQAAMRQQEISPGMWADEHVGACIAFVLGIAWIGRQTWWGIIRSAFGFAPPDKPRTPGAAALYVILTGITIMMLWLHFIGGVHVWMAAVIVAIILVAHLVTSRVIAETGLPVYRSTLATNQIYSNTPMRWLSGRDVYFAGVFTVLGPVSARDSLTAQTLHGLGTIESTRGSRRDRFKLSALIAWSLLIGFGVSAVSTLAVQYSYPTPAAANVVPARNYFGADYVPKRDVFNPLRDFTSGFYPPKAHDPLTHIAIGFVVTAVLQTLSLRWASWPFLPVGFVASYGAFIGTAWFSIFVGWLAKVLIVKFGGSSLYQRARPLFVGMIFGESLIAGVWLLINGIVVMRGGTSIPVKFLL